MQSRLLNSFPMLYHDFTTRHGGCSKIPYSSNNLAFHVGDNHDDVVTNHRNLADKIGYRLDRLVHMRQIHSNTVIVVDNDHNFDNPPECDALITNIPHTPIMVMTADCTPVLLFDKEKNVIAAVHAGRAGAFSNIISETVKRMHSEFGSRPEEIAAAIGPSIHGCCYEVGKDITEEANRNGYKYAISTRDKKLYLDINAILMRQLKKSKIKQENIENINICTACRNDLFFSYRSDKQQTGRMAGIIMLTDIHTEDRQQHCRNDKTYNTADNQHKYRLKK